MIHHRFRVIVGRIWPYTVLLDFLILLVTCFVNFGYLFVTLLVEYCENLKGSSSTLQDSCSNIISSKAISQLHQTSMLWLTSGSLILSLYDIILDYIMGLVLLAAILAVPKIQKALRTQAFLDVKEFYAVRAVSYFYCWTGLLVVIIILAIVENTVPAISNTVHIASILNHINQIINTLQFLAAFEYMYAIELLLLIGVGKGLRQQSTEDAPSSVTRSSQNVSSRTDKRAASGAELPNVQGTGIGSSGAQKQSRLQ